MWPDLLAPWSIFHRCKWQLVAGMAGAIWSGIPAPEIEAVARMIGADLSEEILDDIRTMEGAASQVLNRKEGS